MKIIGVGGYARSGKDAFVSIAKNILLNNGYRPERFAFADNLKSEVGTMLAANTFALDVHTTNVEAKTKLRPLLVWWGCARRDLSDGGLYWVEQVNNRLAAIEQAYQDQGLKIDEFVALVSDVRFPNEVQWLKNRGGSFIHLRRYAMKPCRDGYGDSFYGKVFDDAPNEEEAKNDPIIQELADVKVEWESQGIPAGSCVTKDNYLKTKVLDALNSTPFFKHTTIGILSI